MPNDPPFLVRLFAGVVASIFVMLALALLGPTLAGLSGALADWWREQRLEWKKRRAIRRWRKP